jgi:hypothetical protein
MTHLPIAVLIPALSFSLCGGFPAVALLDFTLDFLPGRQDRSEQGFESGRAKFQGSTDGAPGPFNPVKCFGRGLPDGAR